MTSPGISKSLAIGWGSNKKNKQQNQQPGNGSFGSESGAPDGALKQDTFSSSQSSDSLAQHERDGAEGDDFSAQLNHLFHQMKQSNERVENAARGIDAAVVPLKPVKPIPSALGMRLEEALEKFRVNGLRIAGVAHQYSSYVPVGCVMSQSPSPGSILRTENGIELLISRGSPPDKGERTTEPQSPAISGEDGTAVTLVHRPMVISL